MWNLTRMCPSGVQQLDGEVRGRSGGPFQRREYLLVYVGQICSYCYHGRMPIDVVPVSAGEVTELCRYTMIFRRRIGCPLVASRYAYSSTLSCHSRSVSLRVVPRGNGMASRKCSFLGYNVKLLDSIQDEILVYSVGLDGFSLLSGLKIV